jgi:hypothetical protein
MTVPDGVTSRGETLDVSPDVSRRSGVEIRSHRKCCTRWRYEMGTLIHLPPRPQTRTESVMSRSSSGSAAILFFTGVRYVRNAGGDAALPDTAPEAPRPRRRG